MCIRDRWSSEIFLDNSDQEVMISGLELLIQVQRELGNGKMEMMSLGQTGEMGSRMVERMKTVL